MTDRSSFVRPAFAAVLSICAAALVPGAAAADPDVPKKGEVEIKTVAVSGSSSPRIIVRSVIEQPPKKVWAVVSDCAHYKERLPRVAASKLVKREGNKFTCQVTIEMPLGFSNLTAVTEATHEESDKGMKRSWKLVSGDYTANEGSWEIKPLDGGNSSLVTYTVHAEPKTSIPAFIREQAQKKALPDLIERVRSESAKMP